MALPLLKVAVVGHTNTGKTALIRTLLHDQGFGEVRDAPATTRHVERVRLDIDGEPVIELNDSPGLESAGWLIERLEAAGGERHSGPERVRRMIADQALQQGYPQELEVLQLMLQSDVALYVIDAREKVLPKYLDELALLAACAKPVVPLLNFLAMPGAQRAAWLDGLARVGLHVVVELDAVVRDPQTELRLFEVLRIQLPAFAATLDAWILRRRREEQQRLQAACRAVATLLVDAAAYRLRAALDDPQAADRLLPEARRVISERETGCTQDLLALYRFGHDQYGDEALMLQQTRPAGPLDAQALRHHAQRAGPYLAAGAGLGATIDIATLGLSHGLGTAVGSAVGATIGLARSWQAQLRDRWRGYGWLQVTDEDLLRLSGRALGLVRALVIRGHGSQGPVRVGAGAPRDARGQLRLLHRLRHEHRLSLLNGVEVDEDRRQRRVGELAALLHRELTGS